ncbi:MAG: Gfo/Idh/MocA family oxidoreductase [Streptosporangiaceae bacterium]|jgi:predicted dehydrogenase
MVYPIRVGVVGANPATSWAAAAHFPALASLDEFTVTAVATTRKATAEDAAAAFDAAHAFTDAAELAVCSDVDLVVVSVKSSAHAPAVRAALSAGKHVLCEWPLGASVCETAELSAAAEAAGVVNAIGLQGYHSPSVSYVHDLIADGAIGRVQAVAAVVPGDPLGGSRVPESLAWTTDPRLGTSLLTIMGGHTLGVLDHMTDGITEISGVVANLNPDVIVTETGGHVANDMPGQIALAGRLASRGVISVTIQGGSSTAGPDGFFVRIAGTGGALIITPKRPGEYLNWTALDVTLTRPDGTRESLPAPGADGPVTNVAALYREVGRAIAEGRPAHPDFATALRHHRVLAAMERASLTGIREEILS